MTAPVSMKAGTSIIGVSPEMSFGMVLIAGVFQDHGIPLVVTACTDGKHMPGSLHYVGSAIDLRLPSRFTMAPGVDDAMRRDLKLALGDEWDCVLEQDHIHVEHDPKRFVRPA